MKNKIQEIVFGNLSKLPLNYQFMEISKPNENKQLVVARVSNSEIHQTTKFTVETFYKRLNTNLPLNYLDKTKVIHEE